MWGLNGGVATKLVQYFAHPLSAGSRLESALRLRSLRSRLHLMMMMMMRMMMPHGPLTRRSRFEIHPSEAREGLQVVADAVRSCSKQPMESIY